LPLSQEEAGARFDSVSSLQARAETGSCVSILQNLLASGALELISRVDQLQALAGRHTMRTGVDRGVPRHPCSIFNTEHNSRWET
jgi:hypothetical protein